MTVNAVSGEVFAANWKGDMLLPIWKFLKTYDVAMVPEIIELVRSHDFQKDFLPQENAKWLFKQMAVMEPSPSMLRYMPKTSTVLPEVSSVLVASVDPLTKLLEALWDDYVNLDEKRKRNCTIWAPGTVQNAANLKM